MKLIMSLLLVIIQFSLACENLANNASQASDYKIISAQTSTSVPFELIDNRIFINVKINDQGPFRFILDSGAGNLITPEIADRLKLKNEESFQTGGVGEQTVEAWRTTIAQVRVGDVQATNQRFAVVSLEPIKRAIGFKQLDGLIGFQLFSSLVTKIDYEQNQVTFTQPSKFSYNGDGAVIPFQFAGQIPQVEATIDGFQGKLKIDTGDRSSLTLYVPFIEKNNLREHYAPHIETITGWGIGGQIRAQVARAKIIKLGNSDIHNVLVRLPLVKSGGFMDANVIGSIGTGILKRFNIILDYNRKQLIFEKNRKFSDPDVYDRAGMWLGQNGDDFEVLDVVPDSPAEKSGIKLGDKILAVNGKRSDLLNLPEVRLILKSSEAKEPVKLTLKSGQNQREVLVILKDLV